jgi:hypothetical protein
MKLGIVVFCLGVTALATPGEASDPVVVVQETRTPLVSKQRRSVQHVALLKNVSASPVRGLRVTVEFYDFFGKLLWVRTAVPVPASLGPGDTATLSLSTPTLDGARQTRYRFAYSGAPQRGRPRHRRGGRDPAGRGLPTHVRSRPCKPVFSFAPFRGTQVAIASA